MTGKFCGEDAAADGGRESGAGGCRVGDGRRQIGGLGLGAQPLFHDGGASFFVSLESAVQVSDVMEPGGGGDSKTVAGVQLVVGGYFPGVQNYVTGMLKIMVGVYGGVG